MESRLLRAYTQSVRSRNRVSRENRDEFIIRQVGEKHLSRQLLSFIRGYLCICTCKIILYGHLSSYFLILKAFSIWINMNVLIASNKDCDNIFKIQ